MHTHIYSDQSHLFIMDSCLYLVIIHTLIHTHNHVHSMYMCESEYVHENRQKYFASSSAQNTSQMPTLQYGRLVFPEHA